MKDMYELPLDRYRLFDSQDVEETRARVANVFCDHELELIGRGARLDSRMNCVRIQNVALASITYGGDVRVEPGECESFFPVMALLSGRGTFRSGKEVLHAVPGLVPVASPTLNLSMMLAADTKLAIARIERSALEAKLSDMLDRSLPRPLEFSLTMDTSTRWGHGWYQAFALCAAELDAHDSSWSRSLAARRLESWLMEGLLLAQPSNYSALLNGATPPVPNRAVNIAIELMHAHPEADHSISSLARGRGQRARAAGGVQAARPDASAGLSPARPAGARARRAASGPAGEHDGQRDRGLLGVSAPGPVRRVVPAEVRRDSVADAVPGRARAKGITRGVQRIVGRPPAL